MAWILQKRINNGEWISTQTFILRSDAEKALWREEVLSETSSAAIRGDLTFYRLIESKE